MDFFCAASAASIKQGSPTMESVGQNMLLFEPNIWRLAPAVNARADGPDALRRSTLYGHNILHGSSVVGRDPDRLEVNNTGVDLPS